MLQLFSVSARIAMAKRKMCELTTLWKDWSIPVALKMRLVKTLEWTVLSYGAEAWTLKARDNVNGNVALAKNIAY